jgi:C4-dicarboxylate transporter DctQ subunit
MGATAIVRMMKKLNGFLVIISSTCMCIMVLVIVHGVFMRYVLHQPKAYSVELSSFAMMPVIAFALAYTQKVRGHVRVDLFLMYLPAKIQKVLNLLTLTIFLLYAASLMWAGWELTSMHFSKHMHSIDARIPLWWVSSIFFIGFASLFIQLLLDIGEAIVDLLSDDENRIDSAIKEGA